MIYIVCVFSQTLTLHHRIKLDRPTVKRHAFSHQIENVLRNREEKLVKAYTNRTHKRARRVKFQALLVRLNVSPYHRKNSIN